MQIPSADRCAVHGVVAVIVRDNRFLVIRRSEFVRAPRRFCFPGGEVQPDETEADALIRELQEELSVPIKPRDCLWRSVTSWGVSLAWWHAELPAEAILCPNLQEVESVHWLLSDELLALPELLESNREFLQAHWANGGRESYRLAVGASPGSSDVPASNRG